MSCLGPLSRLASSAASSVRYGSLHRYKIPQNATTALFIQHEDLCVTFRKLNLSPEEAKLSAVHQSSANFISQNVTEYKLPTAVQLEKITVPSLYNNVIVEKDLPALPFISEIKDPCTGINEINDAPSDKVFEKQAARLIIIRRKMMKKHKLKKLRKKMRFEVLKRIQKREYRKEKAFQAEQMAIVREAEAFDAAKYVEEVIRFTKVKPPSIFFKDKRLPAFVVKELMEEEAIKKKAREEHNKAIKEMKKELGLRDA